MSTSAARRTAREFKSLQYFLNRSAVLAQYRQFMRITQPLPMDVKSDVRQQIRAAFELYRDVEDESRVADFLRQGKDQLKHVSDLVDSAVARQRVAEEHAAAHASTVIHSEPETWTENSEGDSGQDDVRGRIGVGWPWKKDEPAKQLELNGIKRR